MTDTKKEPLLKQAESFYVRARLLTEEMDKFKQEAGDLAKSLLRTTPTEDQQMEIEWNLHKADTTRRAAIKFMKRGDKLMKRWEKYYANSVVVEESVDDRISV